MLLLAFVMTGSQHVWAQHKPGNAEKPRMTCEQRMQKQSRHLAKVLLLDDATAAKFMPVYENYLKELRDCRMEYAKAPAGKPDLKEGDKAPEARPLATDAEIVKQMKDGFARSRKMLDIREKYFNEFSKFLTPQQVQKIYQPVRKHARHQAPGCRKQGKAMAGKCAKQPAGPACPQDKACRQ